MFPVIISPYDPEWESWYLQEERNLTGLISEENIVRINLIGSTAVFGLARETDGRYSARGLNGHRYKRSDQKIWRITDISIREQPDNPPPHMMFLKGYTAEGYEDRVFHLHIRYPGDWNELYFRDYLRRHKPAADRYAALKKELAAKYGQDRDGYTKAMTEFINKYTAAAREELRGKYSVKL